MSRSLVTFAFFALGLSSVGAEAKEAGSVSQSVDYAGWATCVWEKVPVTSQNWILARRGELATESPSENVLAKPSDVLEMRMDSVCGELLPMKIRNSIFSSVKRRKQKEILENQPSRLKSKDEKLKLFVCEHWIDGELLFTELGLKKKSKKKLKGSIQKCFSTQSDGSLINA